MVKNKDDPSPGTDSDDNQQTQSGDGHNSTEELEDDDAKERAKIWVPAFKKKWLRGEALEYARETHVATFVEKNARDAKDGTAYGLVAANDMLSRFGIFGPWGADSKAKDDEDDEDYRPYDYVSDEEDGVGKKRVLKEQAKTNHQEQTLQSQEAAEYKRLHIERFRTSFLAWLRYRYKHHEGGNTHRGRGKGKKSSKKKATSDPSSASATGEELSTLLVHELLGIGPTKSRIPHAFQLWAKDLPEEKHKSFLRRFRRRGGKNRDRAGAEMHYFAAKFNKLPQETRQDYYDKRAELKAEGDKKRDELADKVKTRLDPEDAANLIDVMPLILDPLLTSLSAMLNAKISLLIGVPDPREGGELVIKALDKGDNNEPVPVSFGKTSDFAPHIDAFSRFCDSAYSVTELKAAAIPGTFPKSPQKKRVKGSDGRDKLMIVVQSMAMPEGENRAMGAENSEESDDEVAQRRRRRNTREARQKQRESEGEPVKRPRGRPRKRSIEDDEDASSEDDGAPKPKKKMPDPPAKRRKGASASSTNAATTTASGVATLGEVSMSRGRKRQEPSMSANRKKLMSLAHVASASNELQRSGRKRAHSPPAPSPERPSPPRDVGRSVKPRVQVPQTPVATPDRPIKPRPKPRMLARTQPRAESPPRDTAPTTPCPSRGRQTREFKDSPLPLQRHRSRSRPLTAIEEDPMEDVEPTFGGNQEDLGIDAFELPHPPNAFDDMDFLGDMDFSDKPIQSTDPPPNVKTSVPSNTGTERRSAPVKPRGKMNVVVAVPGRMSAPTRVPPNGDHKNKSSGSRSKPPSIRGKPPSTRAASQAPPTPVLNPFDRTSWSDWFTLCYDQLDVISTDEWRTLLNVWTQVEGLAGFRVGKFANLAVDLRPRLLTDWINIRRQRAMIVPRAALKTFVGDYWAWYIALQPEWRDVAGLEGPLTEEMRIPPNGRDWGVLHSAKGRNGLVSVIACLAWWGRHHVLMKGPSALSKQWDDAVADVTYVLQGVLDAGWED